MVRWWGMVMGFLVASTVRFVSVFLGLIGFPWCRYIACLFQLNLVSSFYYDLFAHVDHCMLRPTEHSYNRSLNALFFSSSTFNSYSGCLIQSESALNATVSLAPQNSN